MAVPMRARRQRRLRSGRGNDVGKCDPGPSGVKYHATRSYGIQRWFLVKTRGDGARSRIDKKFRVC